jgi:hypothetical protein
MHPVEHYLKELLFDFDCVTIPGLGGFIMQAYPARIDSGKSRIHPPARFPSFNGLLKHDDGLLISIIARARHISYPAAASIVSEFVNLSKKRISSGEKVSLEGIGELSSAPDGGIGFKRLNALNFMGGVYGMEALNLYPLSMPRQPARLAKRPVDRKPVKVKGKKPASVRWTLALSLPLILFLLYGIIFPASVQNIYTGYSGLVFGFAHPGDVRTIVTAPSSKNMTGLSTATVKIPSPAIVPEVIKETIDEPVVPASPKYYIIGGCFEKEENAVRFLSELISRGFEAEKAGTTNRGHVRISYKSFPDKPSALSYLQKIRNEENASAWLLKY